MTVNLSYVFFAAFFAVMAVFALLVFLKGRIPLKGAPFFGDLLRYLCIQVLSGLAFVFSYVLFIKNGKNPSLSDLGVAFIPLSILIHMASWRYGVFNRSLNRLFIPLAYTVFLLFRFFSAKGTVALFGYLIFNPSFGFIGSRFANGSFRFLGAFSALLPFASAALGRGLALKGIDKRGKI